MPMRPHQSGNVVILILIAVGLFGALAYTFMRGSEQGQGNLTGNQAKIAAQELANFYSSVDKAAQKLLSRGCSENDISFLNLTDSGTFATVNDSATAPTDKSCHVFDTAGGGMSMNMDWTKFQIPQSDFPASNAFQYANAYFKNGGFSVVNLGTAETELSMLVTFVKPEICSAYNQILGHSDINLTIQEPYSAAPEILGDDNTTFAGKTSFCFYVNASGTPQPIIMHIWSIR